jgi:hypothetical protein
MSCAFRGRENEPELPSWNNFVPMGAFATSFICRRDGLSRSDGRSAIGSSLVTPR